MSDNSELELVYPYFCVINPRRVVSLFSGCLGDSIITRADRAISVGIPLVRRVSRNSLFDVLCTFVGGSFEPDSDDLRDDVFGTISFDHRYREVVDDPESLDDPESCEVVESLRVSLDSPIQLDGYRLLPGTLSLRCDFYTGVSSSVNHFHRRDARFGIHVANRGLPTYELLSDSGRSACANYLAKNTRAA
ncbi:MAG TPA: hypothetical protein VJB87_01355 [Candidatus Nanoarchaeia archaeon]|nr:hypothetical protein [Candidatus Nanoarchaeia archaeon]